MISRTSSLAVLALTSMVIWNGSLSGAWARQELRLDCKTAQTGKLERPIIAEVYETKADTDRYIDEAYVKGMLQQASEEAFTFCNKQPAASWVVGQKLAPIQKFYWRSVNLQADYDYRTREWTDIRNLARSNYLQAQAVAEDQAKREREVAAKEADRKAKIALLAQDRDLQRQKFGSSNGIDEFTTVDSIYVNPFRFQGKVVAVRTTFNKMVDARTATFGGNMSQIVVSGTPTTRFTRPNEPVVVAFRFRSLSEVEASAITDNPLFQEILRELKARGGIVSGDFIGAYSCRDASCSDIYQ